MPEIVVSALGIAIYGMFVAIVVPQVKKSGKVLVVVAIAVAVSCILNAVPVFACLSDGFRIIISAVSASLIGAALWPAGPQEEGV